MILSYSTKYSCTYVMQYLAVMTVNPNHVTVQHTVMLSYTVRLEFLLTTASSSVVVVDCRRRVPGCWGSGHCAGNRLGPVFCAENHLASPPAGGGAALPLAAPWLWSPRKEHSRGFQIDPIYTV